MYNTRSEQLDQHQRQILKMPRGSLKMPDGRTLQPVIGYDIRKMPLIDKYTLAGYLESRAWTYQPTRFIVTATLDQTPRFGVLLHVSMSYTDHDPTWAEIKAVRALFFPSDIDVMMMLPKEEDFINLHNHCFHIIQCPQAWDML